VVSVGVQCVSYPGHARDMSGQDGGARLWRRRPSSWLPHPHQVVVVPHEIGLFPRPEIGGWEAADGQRDGRSAGC
jgi:hypothetical protein